jgi:hypothetical protein
VVNIFWIRLTTRNEGKIYLAENFICIFYMENQKKPNKRLGVWYVFIESILKKHGPTTGWVGPSPP